MKVLKRDIILFLMVFISLKIGCIPYFSSALNILWYIFQILFIIYLAANLIYNNRFNKLDSLVMLFYLILLITTLLNKGDIVGFVKDFITFSSLWFTMRYGLETSPRKYIKYMSILLFTYTLINTFSAFLVYPDALFRDNNAPVFFIGADNTSVRIYIFSVCFSFLNSYFSNHKIRFPFIPIINFLIFSFVRDLGGGKACCFILILLILYMLFWPKLDKKIGFKIALFNIVLFFSFPKSKVSIYFFNLYIPFVINCIAV